MGRACRCAAVTHLSRERQVVTSRSPCFWSFSLGLTSAYPPPSYLEYCNPLLSRVAFLFAIRSTTVAARKLRCTLLR